MTYFSGSEGRWGWADVRAPPAASGTNEGSAGIGMPEKGKK